jgi:hypothetical protein
MLRLTLVAAVLGLILMLSPFTEGTRPASIGAIPLFHP